MHRVVSIVFIKSECRDQIEYLLGCGYEVKFAKVRQHLPGGCPTWAFSKGYAYQFSLLMDGQWDFWGKTIEEAVKDAYEAERERRQISTRRKKSVADIVAPIILLLFFCTPAFAELTADNLYKVAHNIQRIADYKGFLESLTDDCSLYGSFYVPGRNNPITIDVEKADKSTGAMTWRILLRSYLNTKIADEDAELKKATKELK